MLSSHGRKCPPRRAPFITSRAWACILSGVHPAARSALRALVNGNADPPVIKEDTMAAPAFTESGSPAHQPAHRGTDRGSTSTRPQLPQH
jgi:hypothetical protein